METIVRFNHYRIRFSGITSRGTVIYGGSTSPLPVKTSAESTRKISVVTQSVSTPCIFLAYRRRCLWQDGLIMADLHWRWMGRSGVKPQAANAGVQPELGISQWKPKPPVEGSCMKGPIVERAQEPRPTHGREGSRPRSKLSDPKCLSRNSELLPNGP